jgi:hypothetical protein
MQVSRNESSSGSAPPAGGEVGAGQVRLAAKARGPLLAGLRRKDKAATAMVIETICPALTQAVWVYRGSPPGPGAPRIRNWAPSPPHWTA